MSATVKDYWLAGSGSWSTAANWSAGVPGANQAAVFPGSATLTVGFSITDSIALLLDSGDPALTLALSAGTLALADGGAFSGTISQTGGTLALNGGLLEVAGPYTASGGALQIASGATYDLLADVPLTGGFINNAGVLEKTGSTGISTLSGTLKDTGTITVAEGTLDFTSGTATLSGPLEGGGEFEITGGTVTLAAGATLGVGTLAAFGSGTDLVLTSSFSDSGAFELGQFATLSLGGKTFTALGPVVLAGTVLPYGTLDLAGNAEIIGATVNPGVVLQDAGTVTQPGSLTLGNSSGGTTRLNINSGAVYTLEGSAVINGYSSASVLNAGTLAVAGGEASAPAIGAAFSNSGTISVAAGTLDLGGPTITLGGVVTGAGTLVLGGNTINLAAGLTAAVGGLVLNGINSTATLSENLPYSGAFVLGAGVPLYGEGHTLTLSGSATLAGKFVGSGTLAVSGAAEIGGFTLAAGATLADSGTIGQDSNIFLGTTTSDTATLAIASGGGWNIRDDASILGTANTVINNAGQLAKLGLAGTSLLNAKLQNSGTVLVAAGTLELGQSVTNTALISVAEGELITEGAVSASSGQSGSISLGNNATLAVFASIAPQETIAFAGTADLLQLHAPGQFGAAVTGFGVGDTIDLPGLIANSFSYTAGTLTLFDTIGTTVTTVASLALPGLANPSSLALLADGQGGTELVLNHSGPAYSGPTQTITGATWEAASGSWTLASNWLETGGASSVPGAANSVLVPTQSGATISYDTTDTIASLQGGAGSTLAITGGSLVIEGGGTWSGALSLGAGLFDAVSGLAFAGPVVAANATTLEVDSGTLSLNGGTLAGTLTGAGEALVAGSNVLTLASGFSDSTATLVVGSGSGSLALATSLAFGGVFEQTNTAGPAETIFLGGNTLTLSGLSTLAGPVAGSGLLDLTGNSVWNGLTAASGVSIADLGTVTVAGSASLGGPASIAAGASLNIAADITLSAATLSNAGLLEATDEALQSVLAAPLQSTGTILSQAGTLTLGGSGADSLAGALQGAGAIALAAQGNTTLAPGLSLSVANLELAGGEIFLQSAESFGGAFSLGPYATLALGGETLSLSGNAALNGTLTAAGSLVVGASADANGLALSGPANLVDAGTITQDGMVSLGLGSSDSPQLQILAGAGYEIVDDTNLLGAGSGAIVNNGLFAKTGTGGVSYVTAQFTNSGTLNVASGTLALQGTRNSLGGTIEGPGQLVIAAPVSATLQPGVVLSVATFEAAGGAALTLTANETYAGNFVLGQGATVNLAAHTLSVTGPSALQGLVMGSGALSVSGSAEANGLQIGGGGTISLAGSLLADGDVTLGTGSDVGILDILAGGTYTLLSDNGILADGSTILNNAGLLQKIGALGTSSITVPLDNTGTIFATNGTLALLGNVWNDATIASEGGTVTIGSTLVADSSKTGTVLINGGEVLLQQGAASSQTIGFGAAGGTLALAKPNTVLGTINGFSAGNTIDLVNLGFAPANESVTWQAGTLSVTNLGTLAAVLNVPGNFSANSFTLVADGTGGTDIVTSVPCFAEGTRIATPKGMRPVEALDVGESVLTANGQQRQIIWIGKRWVDCRRHPEPEKVFPVRIRAGAFGPHLPAEDVLLSPDHAVWAEGVLIPVRHLINGVSIRREHQQQICYYHIELASHELLLAEGLAVESYLDCGNRHQFEGGGIGLALHADFAPVTARTGLAPRITAGAPLHRAKARLFAVLRGRGWRVVESTDLQIVAGLHRLSPVSRHRNTLRFLVPGGSSRLWVLSERFVPAEVSAEAEDERILGVAISEIFVDGHPVPLNAAVFGRGFYALEESEVGSWRWTSGSGEFLLGQNAPAHPFTLDLVIQAFPRRWDQRPALPAFDPSAPSIASRREAVGA
ncbi:MAG: Hint domain-containing protein [Acidobacteriia bacterium]|nr:Hint domain-containing protein [Methyloceanibacter sp.]MCL6491171.1 Hint domain-containing protein [Terriglobia bacterium]